MELMRCGTPRGKEKAIATLLQLCTAGGAVVVEKAVKTPALAVLTRKLLLTGTDRAKRKAVSLSQIYDVYCIRTESIKVETVKTENKDIIQGGAQKQSYNSHGNFCFVSLVFSCIDQD
ncbi:hypothetical protein Bca52824_028742 [Brassica carinata]|uniref:Uncharacterized protein n=1 Tax=Brassica carinata TaxID=52824 RepID=A0A8X8AND3_BRACI|nr:hypothetical protein Bca52824_028742 [Brassica carinata]